MKNKKIEEEGTLYCCDECEYTATTANNLRRRKEIKHEGIRYPCDACEYTATTTEHLKHHKKK